MAHSGKTITFATDLLPNEDNIYSLGTNGQRWRVYGNIQPITTKTYPAYTCSANSQAKAVLFFGKINITNSSPWQTPWVIHYRIYVSTIENNTQGWYDCYFSVQGSTVTYYNYNNFYSTDYRPIYHHSLLFPKSGYSSYGGYFGVRVQDARTPTSLARTFRVELLEVQNCTVDIFDSIKRFDETYITTNNVAASTIWTYGEYTGTSVGLYESGDTNSNDTSMTYERYNHTRLTCTTIYPRYTLAFTHPTDSSKIIPANTTENTTAATKTTITSEAFNIFDKIYYKTSAPTTVLAANSLVAVGDLWYAYSALDLRYSFNLTTTSLTAHKDVFLVCSLVTPTTATLRGYDQTGDNASVLSNNKGPITQTLPSSDDGFIYIKLGRSYSAYQITLMSDHPIYWYKDGSIKLYSTATKGTIGLSNVENTALSTWTGSSNIATVGTITSGTWQGTAIAAAYIGTHTHSYAGSSSAGGAATSANALNFVHTNEILLGNTNAQAGIHINHRRVSGGATSGNTAITDYYFKNGNGATTGVTIHAANFNGLAAKATGDADGNAINTTYLKKSGGTMTGELTLSKANGGSNFGLYVEHTNPNNDTTKSKKIGMIIGGSSGSGGLYDVTKGKWIVYSDTSGNVTLNGTANNVSTTADTTNALYPIGVTSSATTTLKRDTSITMTGGAVAATKYQATHTAGGQKEFEVTYSTTIDMAFMVGTGNENHGIYDYKKGSGTWILSAGADNNWTLNASVALSNITGADDLKAIEALTGTAGFLKKTAANTWSLSNITPVTSVNGHTGSSVSVTIGDLGLSSALRFIGKATSALDESTTTAPTVSGVTNYTPAVGDVILDSDDEYEYVCIAKNGTTYTWEKLGSSSSYSLSTHVHGNLTNDGKLATANRMVWTDANKKIYAANHYVNATKVAINSDSEPSYNFYVSGSTFLNNTTAASSTNLSSQLIVANTSSTAVALELWRNANASWQIANDGGTLYIRNNWTTAKQGTYSQNGLIMDYNTGNTAIAGTLSVGQTTRNTSYKFYVNGNAYTNGTKYSKGFMVYNSNAVDSGSWLASTRGLAPTATTTDGTTTYSGAVVGTSILTLGNNKVGANTSSGVNDNAKGYLRIYGAASGYGELTYNDSMFSSTKSIYLSTSTNSGISNEIRGVCGTNDYWRVAGGATASNAGYMEIATGDDYNEPIYVRQYQGQFTTLKRTATLLDASGNTEFPVQVTAPKFIGTLEGNATNVTGTVAVANGGTGATDAATARTNLGITLANLGAASSGHAHGNITNSGCTTTDITVATGDFLVIADASDSGKIGRLKTTTFDTTKTDYCLTQAGTWAQFGNTYTLPLAANGTRGGVQIGYSANGKNYPVQLSSEKMYVNVPWTDTNTYVTQNTTTADKKYGVLLSAYETSATTTTATTVQRDSKVYVHPSLNQLVAGQITIHDKAATPVEKVSLQWNATDLSLDFVFA